MPTCLFTGEELDEATKSEHVIPKSLGGRIRSKKVTSSDFNNNAGNTVDAVLAERFFPFLSLLSPALPQAARPGHRDFRGQSSDLRYTFDKNGQRRIKGRWILERDADGKPTEVWVQGMKQAEAILKQLGGDGKLTELPLHFTEKAVATKPIQTIGPAIDLGLLRSVLMTWDVLLDHLPEADRFTRSDALQDVRALVRDNIAEPEKVDSRALHAHCLGFHWDPKLHKLMARLSEEVDEERQPFAHVLAVWSTPGTKTVEALWWLFSRELVAFRLTNSWNGPHFAFGGGCGILSNGARFGAKGVTISQALLPNSLAASVTAAPPDWRAVLGAAISGDTHKACRDAVLYVERHCDSHVVNRLRDCGWALARANGQDDPTWADAIRRRITNIYGHTDDPEGVEAAVDQALHTVSVDEGFPPRDGDLVPGEYETALEAHREAFSSVLQEVGKPPVVFSERGEVVPLESDGSS
jgi:hypothetical protein